MNKMIKVGFGLAAAAAVTFAAGCAANAPAYQCGRVDYKSMASCKGMSTSAPAAKAPAKHMKKSSTSSKQ